MKIIVASDIHGSAYYCKKLLEEFKASGSERMVLLGDILYHGPRNDLPRDYAPKEVIAMLNACKDKIYAIRGNCDAEVDQMVLEFPILADYGLFVLNGHRFYATHGHVYHPDHLPPMQEGDTLLYGHTHLFKAERLEVSGIGRIGIMNPGSVSIPKGGNPPTYGLFEGDCFRIKTFDGETVKEMLLG